MQTEQIQSLIGFCDALFVERERKTMQINVSISTRGGLTLQVEEILLASQFVPSLATEIHWLHAEVSLLTCKMTEKRFATGRPVSGRKKVAA